MWKMLDVAAGASRGGAHFDWFFSSSDFIDYFHFDKLCFTWFLSSSFLSWEGLHTVADWWYFFRLFHFRFFLSSSFFSLVWLFLSPDFIFISSPDFFISSKDFTWGDAWLIVEGVRGRLIWFIFPSWFSIWFSIGPVISLRMWHAPISGFLCISFL